MRKAVVAAVCAVVVSVGLSGCGASSGGGGGGTPSPVTSASDTSGASVTADASPADAGPQGYGCLTGDQLSGAFRLKLTEESRTTDAYTAGHGRVGIVFAHMADQNVCEWAPWVTSFGASGYTALSFTSIFDTDVEIADAVAELKRRGVQRVLLVGGSKGGTGVLVAASRPLALPVVAVVSLSAPQLYGGMDASASVPKLTMPVFFMADDQDTPFNDDARALAGSATHTRFHQLKLYPGNAHASGVLGSKEALADFDAFIARYAPPS